MFYLHLKAEDFGISTAATVEAAYETLEAALAQAEHNLRTNTQRPVRIEDEDGNIVKEF